MSVRPYFWGLKWLVHSLNVLHGFLPQSKDMTDVTEVNGLMKAWMVSFYISHLSAVACIGCLVANIVKFLANITGIALVNISMLWLLIGDIKCADMKFKAHIFWDLLLSQTDPKSCKHPRLFANGENWGQRGRCSQALSNYDVQCPAAIPSLSCTEAAI